MYAIIVNTDMKGGSLKAYFRWQGGEGAIN